MNVICSSLRSRLTVPHISSLMFVSLCGPPLESWQPSEYVKSWLALNRRRANSTQCLDCKAGVQQVSKEWQVYGKLFTCQCVCYCMSVLFFILVGS